MHEENLLTILHDTFRKLNREHPDLFQPIPRNLEDASFVSLDQIGLTPKTATLFSRELRSRIGGAGMAVEYMMTMSAMRNGEIEPPEYKTLQDITQQIQRAIRPNEGEPYTLYVDDEEENVFIFRRRFAKRLNLKTFTDPGEALQFIRENSNVALVVTDEVMPKMSGNQLCDEVHRTHPNTRFVLITGNPQADEDLMYRSLRRGRFYEFISKPLDFEHKSEEYYSIFRNALEQEWECGIGS